MPGLHFDITGDNSNFLRKLDETRNGVRATSQQIEESGMSIGQMFGRLAQGAAALGAGLTAKEIVSNIVRVRGEFQQLDVAFKTMLGSEEKAGKLMGQLVDTAAKTPFTLQEVANGGRQLLAYGESADKINDELIRLGNISSGLSQPLGDIVYLYGTTMTQGRLYTEDLNQFTGRGIPMIKELAKQFGVAESKVKGLVESGKVGFPEVQKVIKSLTNEGGMFYNLMEEQSKTITGKISNIGDAFSKTMNDVGKSSEGVINGAIDSVSYLLANYKEIGETLFELIATYGTYKAVLIAIAGYNQATTSFIYAAESAELRKLIVVKQSSINADVNAAVASGKLSQSKAEQLIAIRAEVSAKLQSLQASKAQADADYAGALASYKASTQRILAAKQNMAIAQSQMSIAIKSGTADEIAMATKNAQTASIELNSASIEKNSTHKLLNSAASARTTATDAVNTMETNINTASKVANTSATTMLTIAKERLATVSKALGLSMLADPYVLAAAAVAGLGYGIYKLCTYQTDFEKKQNKLNEAFGEANKAAFSEQKTLAQLKGELSALAKGSEEYNAVKDKIVKNFGKYYDGLNTEIEKVGLTEKAYNKLTEAITKSYGARQYDKFKKEQETELDSVMSDELQKIQENLISKLGDESGAYFYRKIRNSIMNGSLSLGKQAFEIKGLDSSTQAILDKVAGDGVIRTRSIEDSLQKIILATKQTEKLDKLAKDRFGVSDVTTSIDSGDSGPKKSAEKNKDFWKSQLDTATNERDLLSIKDKNSKEWIRLTKLINEAQKNLSVYETPSTSSMTSAEKKLKEEAEKYKLLVSKQGLEKIRAMEDLQMQADEAGINALKDGSEKVIKQMEFNHKKEIQTIDRQKEDLLRKKIDDAREAFNAKPGNKKGKFDPSEIKLSDEENKYFDNLKSSANLKQKSAFDGLIDQYQYYTDKRLAIEKKYDNDIAILDEARRKAAAGGNSEELARIDRAKAEATKSKGKDLMTLDYEKLKESPDYIRAFENLKYTSSETLNSLLSQLESAKSTAAKVLSPDQLREYTSSIQSIMDELEQRNPFGMLAQHKAELAEAEEALAAAKANMDKANADSEAAKNGAKIENGSKSSYNAKTGKINISKTYLTEAQAAERVTKATEDYNAAKDDVTKKSAKVKESEKVTTEQIKKLGSAIKDVGDAIGGQAGAIISMIGDIGTFAMTAMEGISVAADTSATAVSTVEKASVILAIISAAIQLATKVASFFAADYSDYNKAKENYESYVKVLDTVIEKQKELIETMTGKAAIEASEKALDLIAKQEDAARRIGKERLNAGASAGSHSIGVRTIDKMSSQDWNDAKNALGAEFDARNLKGNRMQGLFDLSIDQLEKLQTEAPAFWGKLDDDVKDYLETVIETGKKTQEVIDATNERFTGISFDSLKDNWAESLFDMNTSSQDFADNFEKYLRKAIINSMIVDKYKGDLETLYKNFSKDAQSDNKLTESEVAALKKQQQDLTDKILKEREELEKIFDWKSDTSDSAKSGGFQSMSQDTGNELNGRFTALQISNEEIKSSMMSMLVYVNIISVSVGNNSVILTEIKNLMISSNSYLEDIAKYTKTLLEVGKKLDMIESNTKGLTSR